MAQEKSLFQIIKWKLVGWSVLAVILWVVAGILHFPFIFQAMFVLYAFLGFVVFVLLDLPPMPEISPGKSLVAIFVFYVLCSGLYLGISHALPQFDPEWEKGKIEKILKRKRSKFTRETIHDLYASSQALTAKADRILARLENMEAGGGIDMSIVYEAPDLSDMENLTPEQKIEYGKEVYGLYECYNCHKIGGKGSVKKRGPKLDNIGNLVSLKDMKAKIWDPNVFVSEGFEEEHEEELMPDTYSDIMDELELEVLAMYLMTLTNTNVKTPKPIFHDHEEHKK